MKDTVYLIGRAAQECLQEKEKSYRMKFPWSQETDDWFWLRGEFILAGYVESTTWANQELKTVQKDGTREGKY